MKNIPVDSYIEESPKWEDLSLQEKSEMMKVAIRNGITSLPEIKQAYKEFAEGGNLFRKGGPKRQTSFGNAGSQRAMQYFMNKGLTQAQAAGLVGNLMRESGMQSTALNSSSKAFGIAQWLGPRKKALFARYGSNPTLDQQLDFVWHELNTTHRNGLRHLKASKTAAEAARNVMGYYEFSAGPEAAIAAMNRTGQAGNKSMLRGIEYASKLLGIPVSAEDYTPAVQESPLASPVSDAQQMIQFTPWNPQAFYGYQAPQIEIPMEQPVQNIPTFTKEDVERAQRQQGMETFMALSNLLQPTGTPEAVVPRQRNNPYVAYQEGGNLFKEGGPKASSERIYDVLPRLYAMDGVNVTLSSGNRPGSVVIENGKKTNRKSRHASGMAADIVPGKGSTFADMFRVLRDPNSNVSRYLQSVGGGYLDETSATGTTKYWHDHDRDHSHIHHQIGGYAGTNYGKEIASILGGKALMSTPSTQEQSTFLAFEPANPMAFFNPAAFQTPVIERPVVEPLVEEADVYSQKMQEIEDRRNNLNKLNMMLSLTSPSQSGNSLMSTIGMLTGNYSANGGPIHIKPSHRGRLTELKERTGKTEAELKHDGNPAHKKMVVFAENARKWHGLGGNLYDLGGDKDNKPGSQQMQVGKDYWSQLANKPTWLDTFITPVNGGQLSEVVVKPTNDESWLFSLGKYARNGRKPLADSHARKVVANYLSRFDNESAKDYNARISRLADTLDIRGVQFTKNNVESGKLKNRAHYDTKSNTAYIDDMQDIFAEVAHPWQDAMGNNSMNDEYKMGNYDPDIDSRGGTRYAYPDTFEGETHGFFQPAITEWVETGKIGRSLPLLNEDLSNEKIVPKDNIEVLDSAASWNRQAIDKRVIANPHQLPLTKRIQYSIWDYPLLNKKKALGGNLYDGITEPTQQMDNSYSYIKPLSEVIVDNEGNVRDPEVPSARGTIQLPEVTVNTPDWKDMVGRYSIASNDALRVTGLRPQNTHLNKQAEEGTARRAAWARENPGLETAGLIAGAAPFAVAATPAIAGGGELAYPILTNPYVDAGITSAFAGHGLNHTVNEGIDGWGDAAMTALELTPLGRVAMPMWNAGKEGLQYAAKVGNFVENMPSAGEQLGGAAASATESLTPTQKIFKFLGKDEPVEKASEWVKPEGLSAGKTARWSMQHDKIANSPIIQDLKRQGVDVEKLSINDLKQLEELRKKAIQDAFSGSSGRYAITNADSEARLFGEDVGAELFSTKGKPVEPGAIGSLTFENVPLDTYLAQQWARYDRSGTLPLLDPSLYEGFKVPGMIQNYARDYGVKGVSKDLYSASLFDMQELGTGKGIASGTVLLSPEKTTRVVNPKNFKLTEISPDAGWHQYSVETLDGKPMASWQSGPITGITGTTSSIQFPVKNKSLFDVDIIDNNGIMHIDTNAGSSVRRKYGGKIRKNLFKRV